MEMWRQELKETELLVSLIDATQFSLTVMEEAVDDAVQASKVFAETDSSQDASTHVQHVFSRFLRIIKVPLLEFVDHLAQVIEERRATSNSEDSATFGESVQSKLISEARLRRKLFEDAYLNARREIYYCEVLKKNLFFTPLNESQTDIPLFAFIRTRVNGVLFQPNHFFL